MAKRKTLAELLEEARQAAETKRQHTTATVQRGKAEQVTGGLPRVQESASVSRLMPTSTNPSFVGRPSIAGKVSEMRVSRAKFVERDAEKFPYRTERGGIPSRTQSISLNVPAGGNGGGLPTAQQSKVSIPSFRPRTNDFISYLNPRGVGVGNGIEDNSFMQNPAVGRPNIKYAVPNARSGKNESRTPEWVQRQERGNTAGQQESAYTFIRNQSLEEQLEVYETLLKQGMTSERNIETYNELLRRQAEARGRAFLPQYGSTLSLPEVDFKKEPTALTTGERKQMMWYRANGQGPLAENRLRELERKDLIRNRWLAARYEADAEKQGMEETAGIRNLSTGIMPGNRHKGNTQEETEQAMSYSERMNDVMSRYGLMPLDLYGSDSRKLYELRALLEEKAAHGDMQAFHDAQTLDEVYGIKRASEEEERLIREGNQYKNANAVTAPSEPFVTRKTDGDYDKGSWNFSVQDFAELTNLDIAGYLKKLESGVPSTGIAKDEPLLYLDENGNIDFTLLTDEKRKMIQFTENDAQLLQWCEDKIIYLSETLSDEEYHQYARMRDLLETKRELDRYVRQEEYHANRLAEAAKYEARRDDPDFGEQAAIGGELFAANEMLSEEQLMRNYIDGTRSMKELEEENENSYDRGYMTVEQLEMFYYLYATEGKAGADAYKALIQEELNYRHGLEIAQKWENSPFRSIYGFMKGADGFAQGINQIFSKDPIATSARQYAGMELEGSLETKFGETIFGVGERVGSMAPALTLGVLNPVLGGATAAASRYGSAYGQTKAGGYTEEESRSYAAISAGTQLALQMAGGIKGLGGRGGEAVYGRILDVLPELARDSRVVRVLASATASGGMEIAEGYVNERMQQLLRNLMLDEYADIELLSEDEWKNLLIDGLVGAASGIKNESGMYNRYLFENVKPNVVLVGSELENFSIDDFEIGRSVGAKAKNYDIYDPDSGEVLHFAEETKIQNAEVFAGKGTKKSLHEGVAEGLSAEYGGRPEDWQHAKGYGIIEDNYGEQLRVEVHWFQNSEVGKVKFKIKEWPK